MLDNVYKQGAISRPMFGILLKPFHLPIHGSEDAAGGELTLGGYNAARFEQPLMMVPVSRPYYWQVKNSSIDPLVGRSEEGAPKRRTAQMGGGGGMGVSATSAEPFMFLPCQYIGKI